MAISELAKVLESIRASCSFQVKRFRLRAIKDLAKTTRYVMELDFWFLTKAQRRIRTACPSRGLECDLGFKYYH